MQSLPKCTASITNMSPWIETSELARLNRDAAKQPVIVSREFFDLIEQSLSFSRMTGGAFDITFASVGFLYDYRAGVRPDDQQRQQATALINYHNLRLNDADNSIRFSKPGVRVDLGGIAKGHAVDRSIALLQALGIRAGAGHCRWRQPHNRRALGAPLEYRRTSPGRRGQTCRRNTTAGRSRINLWRLSALLR